MVLVDGIRSRRTHFILLNSAMFGTAAWTAGLAYEATGGTVGTVVPSNLLPLVAMVATRLIVNEAIFSGAVSMMHASFRRALRDNLRDSFGQSVGEAAWECCLRTATTASAGRCCRSWCRCWPRSTRRRPATSA